jgi:hypothetical protein
MYFSGWNGQKLTGFSRTVTCYFLALCLFKYGFDKVFKTQFYLPEPNILYTPMGQVSRDLLFWSTMGSSYAYNLFSGAVELVLAVLLLWRRTRAAGLLMAAGVLLNILSINFSFDISVKLFSILLLGMVLFLLAPQAKQLAGFLFLQKQAVLNAEGPGVKSRSQKILKSAAFLFLFTETLYPYLQSGNFNDDHAPRPYLHGAYEITANDSLPLKRFFIHRSGYIIFQDNRDEMQDLKLDIDSAHHQFILTDYNLDSRTCAYRYDERHATLELWLTDDTGTHHLIARVVSPKNMPLLQNEFHWTVD